MKKKKMPEGMKGNKLKLEKRVKNIALFSLAALAFLICGAVFNDFFMAAGAAVSVALFVPITFKEDPTKTAEENALEKIKTEVKNLLGQEGELTKTQLKELGDNLGTINELLKNLNGEVLKAEVIKLRNELNALKEAGSVETKEDLKSQIKTWVETNKAALANIKAGSKSDLSALVIKLNSPMTPTNTYNGSAYLPQPEFETGAVEIVRVQPTFWDYIKKGRTNSAAYVWVNKKNPEGAAGFIAPGVAKPGISFEIGTEISNAKKVAVSEKCATELLEDIEGMASWIQQELTYQLKQKINTTLMTGTASATVPAGIQTISVPYSLTTVKTTNANNWDAVRACVAQLRSGNLTGSVTAFMNPIDYANMVLTKAQSQGQLFVPAETGATIVEDNNVPVGYVQVALLDYYKVKIYKDISIAFGFENDDFTKNLVTSICEMRLHQYFSENHTGAFIYDTFDNIKTAITTV